jgi:hypothetical protein
MAAGVIPHDAPPVADIHLGSSSALPPAIRDISAVVASPPYCTRIDYAVATMPELAVLGCPLSADFVHLRRQLIGGTVVDVTQPTPLPDWGDPCLHFLEFVKAHRSKGSTSYYYKLFLQYFGAIHSSMLELRRVLLPGGWCILVVQDSHYKTERVDIGLYITDMATSIGWTLQHRTDFETALLMARVNPRSRKYRDHWTALESVLWFKSP